MGGSLAAAIASVLGWTFEGPLRWGLNRLGFGAALVLGRRLIINRTLSETLGRAPDFVHSLQAWFDEVYDRNADAVRDSYEQNRAAGWRGTAVIPLPLPTGGYASVAFSATRLGPFELWLMADVTARLDVNQRCRLALEASSVPHVVFDGGRIVACNQAAAELLGYPDPETLVGIHPALLSPERQPDGRLSSDKSFDVDRRVRLEGRHRFGWHHLRADGSEIPVEVTLTRLELPSGSGMLGVWRDLGPELSRLETAERQRELAEAGLEARRRFLAATSHEIRTAMNGVLGLSEGLRDRSESLPADVSDRLRVISESGRSLRQLLDDLLDFTRFDSGQVELSIAPFSMEQLLGDVLRLHRAQAEARGNHLELRVIEGLPSHVLGDADRVRQVVHKLVANSVKFTHEGRIVVIADADPDGTGVRLRIRDTGVGMSEEQQAQAFSPFERSSGGRQRFGGAGLGLAIVERLVQAMDGSIELYSVADDGTTAEVRLPLRQVEPTPRRERATSSVRALGRSLEVLIAEDDPINRLVLETLLESVGGLRLRFVENGAEALAAERVSMPDLVLMDVHMPELDGLEATRRLRAEGYEGPIVALTASVQPEERISYLAAGMDEVLGKPVERSELMRVVKSAAARRIAG